jgi:hypothetical protein
MHILFMPIIDYYWLLVVILLMAIILMTVDIFSINDYGCLFY